MMKLPGCFLCAPLQDTVAVQELRFGDNDTLSAQVATLVEADYLFLVTDVDALYTANPKVRCDGY
jgi:glutamate 5-kinase